MKKKMFIFIQGIGSIIDIAPVSPRTDPNKTLYTPADRDIENWRNDWEKVGNDMRHAMTCIANEQR